MNGYTARVATIEEREQIKKALGLEYGDDVARQCGRIGPAGHPVFARLYQAALHAPDATTFEAVVSAAMQYNVNFGVLISNVVRRGPEPAYAIEFKQFATVPA